MTEQQTPESQAKALAANPVTVSLLRKGMEQVAKGKATLSDLFQTVVHVSDPVVPDKRPPAPKPLTDEQKDALKRLPEVYGKVVVTADRKLEPKELKALVEERQVIDTLLTPLKNRKEESIREVLANHFDNILDDEKKESARRDAKGHFAEKQEASVPGTGKKAQRIVSGGKPRLTMDHVEQLLADGLIDRKTYLAITKKPDAPRVLDEDGLHKAIQKDPVLFFLLGSVAEPTLPTTTIKVVNDS